MLVRDTIANAVAAALEQANRDGAINVDSVPDIEVERPNNAEHGDFATNLPLRLARAARANPLQLAQLIAERIESSSEIDSVAPAPPGFINFKLSESWLQQQVEAVRAAGDGFGASDVGAGRKVMVEFVKRQPHRSRPRGPYPRRGPRQRPGQHPRRRRLPRYPRVLHQRRRLPDGSVLPLRLDPLPPGPRPRRRDARERLSGRIHRRHRLGDHRLQRRRLPGIPGSHRRQGNRRRCPRKDGVPHPRRPRRHRCRLRQLVQRAVAVPERGLAK